MKTVVLIDGSYLTFALRDVGWKLDYRKLIGFLKERYAPVLRVSFYIGSDPNSDRQTRFLKRMQELGYTLKTRTLRKVGEQLILRGLDIDLAVDMLSWADSCDRVVLLSGDADLAGCLDILARKGVVTEVLAFQSMIAHALRTSGQEFTDLTTLMPALELESGGSPAASVETTRPTNEPALWQLKGLQPEGLKDLRAAWNGIRLERALRDLCAKQAVKTSPDDGLDALSNRLTKAGVYDKLTQKRILVWAEIRNSSVHGHFTQYSARDVDEMEEWIEKFIEYHVGK